MVINILNSQIIISTHLIVELSSLSKDWNQYKTISNIFLVFLARRCGLSLYVVFLKIYYRTSKIKSSLKPCGNVLVSTGVVSLLNKNHNGGDEIFIKVIVPRVCALGGNKQDTSLHFGPGKIYRYIFTEKYGIYIFQLNVNHKLIL